MNDDVGKTWLEATGQHLQRKGRQEVNSDRPTYRFELRLMPHPDAPKGTLGKLAFGSDGHELLATLQYMGNGRWLAIDLARWLDETPYMGGEIEPL